MLKRKVTDELARWKRSSDKALLITGARQIGKSFAIREFGKANFEVYFEANLLLDADARESLPQARNAADFISRVSMLSKQTLVEGKTLIFIDEVQEFPQIVTLVKALVEDGRFAYALSGSMLGTEFKGISSFPVGYVKRIVMRPLDFEEFCWGVGVSEGTLADIRTHMTTRTPVEQHVHDAMMRNFQAYLVAGGMPEVVQDYIDSKYSLIRTREIQHDLVEQYKVDISKYAGKQAFAVREIFERMPTELEGENHRFTLSALKPNARIEQCVQDFLWLKNAGVALVVARSTEARAPLLRTQSPSYFKLYESDTGMLVSRYPQSTSRAIFLGRRSQNLGGIFENAIAQELASLRIAASYYYAPDVGEVDFLIEGRGGRVIAIEVKSGKKVRAHAALDKLLEASGANVSEGIVLSHANVSREDKVSYLPLYMTFCLDELVERESEAADFNFAPTRV